MLQTNVFGEVIEECCSNPITGYFRDGFCRTDKYDRGSHTVCAVVTSEFLDFSLAQGNDLSTRGLSLSFPVYAPVSHGVSVHRDGLKPMKLVVLRGCILCARIAKRWRLSRWIF